MGHPNARLTPYSRQALAERVIVGRWPATEVARHFGVSRSTAYKWVRRYREEGAAGLLDRSSRPHRSPRALPAHDVALILATRHHRRYGPHRLAPLTGHPRSTIYGVLRRAGVARLDGLDRLTGRPVRRRYEADYPGALLHQDAKPFRGRVLEVFVDDRSRLAFVVLTRNAGQGETVRALETALRWYAGQGIRIERLLTDNGSSYCSRLFADALARHGIRHSRTRVRRPQTNGKAERFIGTLIAEWADARPERDHATMVRRLYRYLDFYNRSRPHTALHGRSPLDVVSTT
jgi:transposase InsO family protein